MNSFSAMSSGGESTTAAAFVERLPFSLLPLAVLLLLLAAVLLLLLLVRVRGVRCDISLFSV
jgi:hypothetical protein